MLTRLFNAVYLWTYRADDACTNKLFKTTERYIMNDTTIAILKVLDVIFTATVIIAGIVLLGFMILGAIGIGARFY